MSPDRQDLLLAVHEHGGHLYYDATQLATKGTLRKDADGTFHAESNWTEVLCLNPHLDAQYVAVTAFSRLTMGSAAERVYAALERGAELDAELQHELTSRWDSGSIWTVLGRLDLQLLRESNAVDSPEMHAAIREQLRQFAIPCGAFLAAGWENWSSIANSMRRMRPGQSIDIDLAGWVNRPKLAA